VTDPVSSNPLLRPFTRVVVTLWVIFAVALAVKLACWPNKHTVFPVYHAAVQATMAGDSPYDRVGDLDLFRYPPPSLWLFFPFGVLPVRVGGALWGICSVGMTLWGVLRLWRWALPGAIAWSDRRVAVYLLVTFLVASRGLWNAQANGLLGGFIFLAVAELARARTWLSSFAMAAALLLKPTMLSVPMLLAAWRPAWGLRLLGALGAIVLLTAVPSPRQSAWLWEKWVEHGKSSAGERRAAFRDAWTLGLTAVDLVRPGTDDPPLETPYARWYYPAIPGGFAFLALGTGWWLSRNLQPQAAICLMAALGTCWMLLFGPAIEHPTYLLAAPWLGWALVCASEAGPWRSSGLAAGLCGALLIFVAGGLKANPLFPPLSASMPIAMVLLSVWLVAWGLEQGRAGGQSAVS